MFSKTGFEHSELCSWKYEYAGTSLNANGKIKGGYTIKYNKWERDPGFYLHSDNWKNYFFVNVFNKTQPQYRSINSPAMDYLEHNQRSIIPIL
jgi:hypothetical protein